MYLKKVREGGGAVSAGITVAAARGILLACDRSKLAEFGRPVSYSLLKRMMFARLLLPRANVQSLIRSSKSLS